MKNFVLYTHHNKLMSVREDLKGKHRDYCLCYSCAYFHPGEENNCKVAQSLLEFDIANDVTTPVWECARFGEPKTE